MCNNEQNIYILSAMLNEKNVYAYYKINGEKEMDIRYIRENGLLIGILDIDLQLFFKFVDQDYSLNKIIGNKFSVFQEIYSIDDTFLINVKECSNFPKLRDIKNIIGYKIKNNISENYMYYEKNDKQIIRLYPYDILLQNGFNIELITPYIYNNDNIYISS